MKIVKFHSILTLIIITTLLGSCGYMPQKQMQYYQPQPYQIPQSQLKQPEIIEKRIKVALLVPLSGKHKQLGESLLNSATLSLFDNDKKDDIELVVFDSKGTPFGAKDAMKEIVKQDIKIVIGPVFSSSVESVAEMVANNDIIALSFSNNMELINNKGIFLMGFFPEQQIEKTVNFAMSQGKNSFSVIASNNQYGLKISNIVKQTVARKDGNFITSELYMNNDRDLDRSVKRLVNAYIVSQRVYENQEEGEEEIDKSEIVITEEDKIYPDVIFIPESGKVLSIIMAKMKQYNTNERDFQIIGSNSWDKPSTLKDLNLIGSWFPAPESKLYEKFQKKYYSAFKEESIRIDSIAYDAVNVITKLVKNNNSDRGVLTMEDFIHYKKSGFKGIDGLFRFLPDGIVERNLAILEVKEDEFNIIESPTNFFLRY